MRRQAGPNRVPFPPTLEPDLIETSLGDEAPQPRRRSLLDAPRLDKCAQVELPRQNPVESDGVRAGEGQYGVAGIRLGTGKDRLQLR